VSDVDRFIAVRPRLLGIAYRLLGSAADAEEVVQDAYVRWQQTSREDVVSAERFLVKTVTRLALDRLALARNARELYPGTWLPEPVSNDWPGVNDKMESVSLAFLVLLETLSPMERAVFILHEVFDYSHAEIAPVVERDEAACRQILKRAKDRLRERRPRFPVSNSEHAQLLEAFATACTSGDLPRLRDLLAEQVTLWSDGGGKVAAALHPVSGGDIVAKFLLGQMRRKAGLSIGVEDINGKPTIVARRPDGGVEDVVDLVTDGERIVSIFAVRNPDKLRQLSRVM
jgi:RNA polymerase sigma-70 factor (ECF subfamily)